MSFEIDFQKLIIDEPDKFSQFQKFLQMINPDSGLLNLNFYLACIDLKKRFLIDSGKSLLRLIRSIYRNYLKSSTIHSTTNLAISNQTKKSIRMKIKLMNETNIDQMIFQRAYLEVEEYLEKKYVVEFRNHNLINRINETPSNTITDNVDHFLQYRRDSNGSTDSNNSFTQRKSSRKSDDFDPNKFHKVLTERLSKLNIPLKEENCSLKSLAAKSNNEFLLKLIQSTQNIDIDIEADALSALDNQYKKIGRLKQHKELNKDKTDIYSFNQSTVKDSLIRSNIPYFWQYKLQNQELINPIDCDLNSTLFMNINQCQCHKN